MTLRVRTDLQLALLCRLRPPGLRPSPLRADDSKAAFTLARYRLECFPLFFPGSFDRPETVP